MKFKLLFLGILVAMLQNTSSQSSIEEKVQRRAAITKSLEDLLHEMKSKRTTKAGNDTTFIQLLSMLEDLLAQLKDVNDSLKEVAVTTKTAGIAATLASEQLDLLLGE